jgi:hypothetical protein
VLLARANQKLAASFATFSQLYDRYDSALLAHDLSDAASALLDFNALGRQIRAQRTAWRIAVTAAALRVGISVPNWVRKVGTG